MLIWIITIILFLTAIFGWLFLKRDSERYIHEKKSPMNFFFKWGRFYHHIFKIVIIVLFMLAIFSLYKYLLRASKFFALTSAVIAGIILSGGKELLDKKITLDDVLVSIFAIASAFTFLFFLF